MSSSPPHSLKCREIRPDYSENSRKWAQFRDRSLETGPEKMARPMHLTVFAALFSAGHPRSPVSMTPRGECNAIVLKAKSPHGSLFP
jgi:hypothetical protein